MANLRSAEQYAQLAWISVDEVNQTYRMWRNLSNLTDDQLATYVEYYYYYQYSALAETWAEGIIFMIFGMVGLVGHFLEVFVLRHKEFLQPTFIYHKTIVAIDLLAMPFLIEIGITNWIPTQSTSFITSFVTNNVCRTVQKFSIMAGDYVTFFMSIERTLALWSPILLFPYVNTKSVASILSVISISLGLLFVPDFYKYDIDVSSRGAVKRSSQFAVTPGYKDFDTVRNSIQLVKGYGAIGLTLIVIAGVIRHSKRRGKSMNKGAEALKAKRDLQLCFLCLSCSLPVVVNTTLFVVYAQYFIPFIQTIGVKSLSLPYDEALGNVTKGVAGLIDLFLANFAYCIGHCCHFYFYYWLHSTFRRIARGMLKLDSGQKQNAVAPSFVINTSPQDNINPKLPVAPNAKQIWKTGHA